MIAILGASEDDLLYFRNKMVAPKAEPLVDDIVAYTGKYSGTDVVLCRTKSSNEMSGIVTSLIISKYDPYLVIATGTVQSVSAVAKQSDFFVAERVYFGDIDFTRSGRYEFGEIPETRPFFVTDSGTVNSIEKIHQSVSSKYLIRGTVISMDRFYDELDPANELVNSHFLSSGVLSAFDSESGGVALACFLHDIPYAIYKTVNYEVGKDSQKLSLIRKGLEGMPIIGKVVSMLIRDRKG